MIPLLSHMLRWQSWCYSQLPLSLCCGYISCFLYKNLWNVLTGRTYLCCCSGKGRFGESKSQHFNWSIHREQRSGENTSVIEIVAPMIVAESPPREYSRSSYLSISFYLPTYLSHWSCHTTIPSSSLNLGTILSVLISLRNSSYASTFFWITSYLNLPPFLSLSLILAHSFI